MTPADIDYIEAHGTGTPLGDPIELDSLSKVFADREGREPLVLGAVKTNLGHLEAAAGIAGFMKSVLAVGHGRIPRNLNFRQLTPHASEGVSRLTIATEEMEWPATDQPRRAGVSSFGVSGTNAHVVIEQARIRRRCRETLLRRCRRWWCRVRRRSGWPQRPLRWPIGWKAPVARCH
ncbi:beta-ketoacyl synthase, C-terminal domain protein [Mycobacterium ulcerans str. Harvey]|uniref:Beta-ketoacyl synthase, C-terminal domain protein n=1 Tax=Mycobacterium ulcerans str. Harvey TaxID=1299332 RepID=A0ABN0R097_MYCUL|nr:beta-ketoacyl synthase, C-terminal domain protein [Mycobacterium ulcerans str. Harvey]